MAVSDQDHGGVPMPIAVVLGGLDQPFDLRLGQMLPRAQILVGRPFRSNCSIYSPASGGVFKKKALLSTTGEARWTTRQDRMKPATAPSASLCRAKKTSGSSPARAVSPTISIST